MSNLIVRIDLGPHGRLGPGKIELLQKIDEFGSISAAGRSMHMSYRQAWALVDQLNQAFQEPVVTSKIGGKSGGGAELTEFGRLLVTHCNSLIHLAEKSARPHLQFIDAVLNGRAPPPAKNDATLTAAGAQARKAANAAPSKSSRAGKR